MQTRIPAKDLEIDDDEKDAIALVIYITRDKNGQSITDSGSVMFSDVDGTSIATGDDADSETMGIRVFTMPDFGVFVRKATVDYIRKK